LWDRGSYRNRTPEPPPRTSTINTPEIGRA